MRKALRAGFILVLGILAAPAAGQGSIELRAAARVADGAAVTLADVARLDGADAAALGGVVLVEPGGRSAGGSVSLADVRRVLEARGGVNWGRIALRGSACSILPVEAAPVAPQTPARPAPAVKRPVAEGSVRAATLARIAQLLRASPDDVKVEFDAGDDGILDLSVAGRTLEVRPAGSSDRMPLAVTLFEGDRVVASKTIRVKLQVRRDVVVAIGDKRRGDTIEPGDVTVESRWLTGALLPPGLEQVIGTAAQGRLQAGQVVMAEHVAPAVAANKGDVVAVRCVSGSLVVSTRGRALSSAKDGEVVQLQALDSKRTFFARMNGRGRAILTAGPAAEPAERSDDVRDSLPVRGDRYAPPTAALEATR